MSRTKISQIKHQILNRVSFLFERSGNRQSLSLIKKAEQDSAAARFASLIDQSELTPRKGGSHR
jgi:hypothetical protein